MKDKFDSYHNAVRFLENLQNLKRPTDQRRANVDPEIYIKRLEYFLNLLGDPGKNIKYVHITGTSGKGSVATMVHRMLVCDGKKAGLFTSPYLTTSIEKIKVGNLFIEPQEFAEIVEDLKPFLDRCYRESPFGMPSYFEIFFALALIYFEKQKCEWAVIEVGLGGRYDATNVISNTKIAAITMIDYDHTDVLGKTLTKIATDKAGIIKPGCQFFTAEHKPHLLKIFKQVCAQKGADYHRIGGRFATYQDQNKSLASEIGGAIGLGAISIKAGTDKFKLPCRFEVMQNNPLIVLDGAHNQNKIASTVSNIKKTKFNKLRLVIGLAKNKDLDSILSQIIPLADTVVATRFQLLGRDCAHPVTIIDQSRRYLKSTAKTNLSLDPFMALDYALAGAKPDDLVLVTGSFYLTGDLRRRWYPEEWVLSHRRSF